MPHKGTVSLTCVLLLHKLDPDPKRIAMYSFGATYSTYFTDFYAGRVFHNILLS